MKRFALLLLALFCLTCLTASALAEGNDPAEPEDVIELDRNTMIGNTEVSLTVDRSQDTFVVVIPSKVTIDPKTQYGYGDLVLKAGWELVSVNSLTVKLTSAENGIGIATNSSSGQYLLPENFRLKTEDGKAASYSVHPVINGSAYYPFTSKSGSHSSGSSSNSSVYYGSDINTFQLFYIIKSYDNTIDRTCEMVFHINTMPSEPGIYTDTLTFSIITQ